MTAYAYPYDSTASAAENVVRNETHALADYPNRWGSVIPKFAPFYRKDLVVKHKPSGRTLLEGIDYYLGHRFKDASTANKMPVYGSIMIIDRTLAEDIDFHTYRTLGGEYTVPFDEILEYLAREDNEDPRNADWEDVVKYPRTVPDIAAPDNRTDAIRDDIITNRLNEIALTMKQLAQDEEDAYIDVLIALSALGDKIHDFDVREHANRDMPHDVTYVQLNANQKDATVVNALKAYGLTLAQLVTFVESVGVEIADQHALVALVGDTLQGRLKLDGNNFVLQSKNGASTIDLKNGDMNVIAAGNVVLSAQANVGQTAVGLQSGMNSLTAHRPSPVDVSDPVIFNGHYVIHAGNVADYVPTTESSSMRVYTSNTEFITLRGLGTASQPLTGDLSFPIASGSKAGIVANNSSTNSGSATVAATPRALQSVIANINKLADDSVTVNGKRLTGNISFVKGDFGLGRVDNTATSSKPASDAFKAAANNKVERVHTHSLADLEGLGIASPTVKGLVRLATTLSEDTDSVVTTSVVRPLEVREEQITNDLYETIPSMAFDVTKYGDNSYLPMPAIGSYPAAGINTAAYPAVGLIEEDGRLVLLRNGADLSGSGVYYVYATFKFDGTFDKYVSTATEYRPAYLPSGQRVLYVSQGTEDVFLARVSDGRWHLILTRGTMDGQYHVGAPINPNSVYGAGRHNKPFIYGDSVYIIRTDLGNVGFYVRLVRVSLADIEAGGEVTTEIIQLSGTDAYGDPVPKSDQFKFVQRGLGASLSQKPFMLRNDEGRWSSTVNSRHTSFAFMQAMKGSKLRVNIATQYYLSSPTDYKYGGYGLSFTVDLETLTAELDSPERIPFTLTKTGVIIPGGSRHGIPGAASSRIVQTILSKNKTFGLRFYGSRHTPTILVYRTNNYPDDMFEALNDKTRSVSQIDSRYLEGARGSVAKAKFSKLGFIDGSKLIGRNGDGSCIISKYDVNGSYLDNGKGFGPTSYRKTISGSTYTAMLQTTRDHTKSPAVNVGTMLNSDSAQYTRVSGETVSAPISLASGVHAAMRSEVIARHTSIFGSMTHNSTYTSLVIVGDPYVVGDADYFVHSAHLATDKATGRKYSWQTVEIATCTVSGSKIVSCSLGENIIIRRLHTAATRIRNVEQFGSNHRYREGGHTKYLINSAIFEQHVGDGKRWGFYAVHDGTNWTAGSTRLDYYLMAGYHYHPNLGAFSVYQDKTGESTMAQRRDITVSGISGVKETVPIHSTQVASGLIIYLSEEVPFYHNGRMQHLPVSNFDLQTLFPNEYRNQTFQIYVMPAMSEDVQPTYAVVKDGDEPLGDMFYVGYCKTDNTQIVDLLVQSGLALGEIREVSEHAFDRDAHDGKIHPNKDKFGGGNVENMTMLNTLTLPTFKEVFNNWKRISHKVDVSTYPAMASEMNSWSYSEASDTIVCGINSRSFVGFVSNEPVGDFVFDALVGSPDGDNDALAIILAFVEKDGVEHTLVATRTRSIEGHMRVSSKFDIWYNYHQPTRKLIATTPDYTANEGGFSGRFSRMRAVRKGTDIEVRTSEFVAGSDVSTFPDSNLVRSLSVDLTSDPKLSVFLGGAAFGYGCMSQPSSMFVNIQRPDEDVGNYYATADLVRLAAESQAKSVAFRQGLVSAGSAVPIPTGFSADECHVVLDYHTNNAPTVAKTEFRITYDPNTLVTKFMYHDTSAWVTNAGTLKYYLVARKK